VKRFVLIAAITAALAVAIPAVASAAPTPTGVTGIALSGSVQLAWQPAPGATGYTVYRGTSPASVTTRLTPPAGVGATTFTDSGATNGTTYYYAVRSVDLSGESGDSLTVQVTPKARACSSGNAVVVENCYAGNSGWDVQSPAAVTSGGIEGYATATSINRGGSVGLKVNTQNGATYRIEIYRTGYYGGNGARLFSVIRGLPGVLQPACPTDSSTGMVDCSSWSLSTTLTTTAAWPTGIYILRLVREDNGSDNQILLVVRDDSASSDILYGTGVSTFQAYNNYGGKSLYDFNSSGNATVAGSARAVKVSYDRPYEQPRSGLRDWYTRTEFATVYWLEREGFDVSYIANTDLEGTVGLSGHQAYISPAHDEYVSAGMRAALQAGRDSGVGLFFSGGNELYWKIRFENGGRTQVCYKSTQSGGPDPSGIPTGTWRDPAGANNPENGLTGVMYVGDADNTYFPLVVSAAEGTDRVYRYTGLDTQAPGTSTSLGSSLIGWEWDARVANGREPAGVKTLASSPVTGELIQANGAYTTPGSTSVNAVKYTAPSGALVFSTGTNHWNRGLALNAAGVGEPNQTIQQVTTNVLSDMGATPQTPAGDIELDAPTAGRPDAPTGVSATPAGADGITISWNAVAGADGYNVYRLLAPRSGGQPLGALANPTPITGTSFTDTGLAAATTYYYVVTTLKAGLQSVASGEANATTPAAAGESTRINAGGPEYTASTGASYRADSFSTGGATNSVSSSTAISGTNDPALYRDERWGQFSYAIPVADGTYDVRFHFAELYYGVSAPGGPGKRVFGMDILDTPGQDIQNLDIYAQVGANAALVQTVPNVTVTDGTLNIQSVYGSADDPQVAAIEVVPTGGQTAAPTVTSTTPASGTTGVVSSATPTATFSRAMDASTINPSTFTLTKAGGAAVAGTVSYNSGSLTATFTPAAALDPSTTYEARVTTGAQAGDGTALAADVVWSFTTAEAPVPPAVSDRSPSDGAAGVSRDTAVTATFTRTMDATTITGTSFTLRAPDGSSVPATVSYDTGSRTATLTPNAKLAGQTAYTAQLETSIKAADGTPLANTATWTFTTTALACPCRLFPATATPALTNLPVRDNRPYPGPWSYEMGVKITVDQPMRLTSIRFWKGSQETGTHTGTVWSSTGTQLASVTFTSETTSGWQEQALPTPLNLQAGNTYVVSVNANAVFAGTSLGLASEIVSGPLRSVADGKNGVYGSAAGVFPTNYYNSSNYYVDAVVDTVGTPTAPTLTQTPAGGATDLPRNTTVTAAFSRAMDQSTITTSTFTLKTPDGTPVPAAVTYDRATQTATLTPNQPLDSATTYTARLTTAVTAADGAPLDSPVTWTFTTAAAAPAPTITGRTPADGATGIDRGTTVTATFSRSMDASTITSSTFTLTKAGGAAVAGTVSYDSGSLTATFTPTAALDLSTTYEARITTAALTTDGAGLAADAVWSFTTAAAPAPPAVSDKSPADGAQTVSRDTAVRATFTRTMDATTITDTSFTLRAPDGSTVPATVSYDTASRTATLTPNAKLAGQTAYTAQLETSIKAADGTPLASTATWTFTTTALACPCRLFPATATPALANQPVRDNRPWPGPWSYEMGVKITVDQPMLLTSIRFWKGAQETGTHIGKVWSATGAQLATVTFTSETASGWQEQQLATPLNLQAGNTYVVSVNANAVFAKTPLGLVSEIVSGPLRSIADGKNGVYGNAAGAFPANYYNSSNYYVDAVVDTVGTPTAPTLTQSPADGTLDVARNTTVTAAFSRAMDQSTITASTFTLKTPDGTPVPAAVTYDRATQTATLTPNQTLDYGIAYTARLTTAVAAADGAPLDSPSTWTFTTVGLPTAPTVSDRSPADGALDVDRDTAVTATFSRSMDASTITGTSFTLQDGTGQQVAASVTYNDTTKVARLTPNADLAVGTTYTATVAGTVKAADGTPLAAPVTWTFTTNGSDCPCRLFASNPTPTLVNLPTRDGRPWPGPWTYEMGVKFTVDSPVDLTAIRFYKSPLESGVHVGKLWTSTGTQLGSVTFTGESGSGWQSQALDAPITLQPGTVYVVSVNMNAYYQKTTGGLAAQIVSGPLRSVADGQNGVFASAAGQFPTGSYQSANYFVDLVVR